MRTTFVLYGHFQATELPYSYRVQHWGSGQKMDLLWKSREFHYIWPVWVIFTFGATVRSSTADFLSLYVTFEFLGNWHLEILINRIIFAIETFINVPLNHWWRRFWRTFPSCFCFFWCYHRILLICLDLYPLAKAVGRVLKATGYPQGVWW